VTKWLLYKELLFTAFTAISWFVYRVRFSRAQSWPVTQGVVEYIHLVDVDVTHQLTRVSYSYYVNGEFYSGTYPIAHRGDLVGFVRGERIWVHYKLADPSISFLDRQDVHLRKQAAAA
jgi:Protein of unknown function (DUF3592)